VAETPTEQPSRPIRVLILEERELIRRGLLAITSTIPELTATILPVDAPRLLREARFDVTLLSMATLVEAAEAGVDLEELRPVIVIVPDTQPQQLEIVTRWPVSGYLIQDELTAVSLRAAVIRVVGGQLAIPQAVTCYLLNRVRDEEPVTRPRLDYLSPREEEVLRLLVGGASNKEIARKLGISVHGVKRHVSTLLNHFHSPNRVHLVSHVLQSGILGGTHKSKVTIGELRQA
jgi:DNA-binding NarL/FixJ family response regulator